MRVRAILAAASLMLGLEAVAQVNAPLQQDLQAAAPSPQGLIAPGRSPELEILFTGDVIGFLEPCG